MGKEIVSLNIPPEGDGHHCGSSGVGRFASRFSVDYFLNIPQREIKPHWRSSGVVRSAGFLVDCFVNIPSEGDQFPLR